MTDTVVSLDERRTRKVPAWNPDTRRHAWQDIDEDGHHHKCVHCWVRYHHEPSGAGYVKVWSHGARNGRSTSLGPCPGPSGRPVLEVVGGSEPASVPPTPVAEFKPAPATPAAARVCRRCNPTCGRPGRPYLGGISCEQVVTAAGAANREWVQGMRSSGGAA